jgi:hypothetical protein
LEGFWNNFIIIKNEIPTWIMWGFIAWIKGNPINWAKVVELTIKKSMKGWGEGWVPS